MRSFKIKNSDKTLKIRINRDGLARLIKNKIAKRKSLMVKAQSGDCNDYLANCCSCCGGCECMCVWYPPANPGDPYYWGCNAQTNNCPPGYESVTCFEPNYSGSYDYQQVTGLCACIDGGNPLPTPP